MTDKPALTYPVPVLHLPQKGVTVKIGTDEKERAALAADHGLEAVNAFAAEFLITPWKKDGIRVRGRIDAEIVQSCVVTLEPLTNSIAEEVDTIFVPKNSRLARIQLDEEFFDLAIDPYPRKPGLPDDSEPKVFGDDDGEEKPVSPFAKLSEWQKKP